MVACNTLTTLGGRWLGPPPTHRLGRERTLSSAHTIFNHNFKIKISNIFWNYFQGYFLKLMFVYSTSVIYLTLRIKFWNLSCNFRENTIYPWPKFTFLLLTNDILLYCMIWLSTIHCSAWNFRNMYFLIGNKYATIERKPCNMCVRKGVDVLNALPPAKFPLFSGRATPSYSLLPGIVHLDCEDPVSEFPDWRGLYLIDYVWCQPCEQKDSLKGTVRQKLMWVKSGINR